MRQILSALRHRNYRLYFFGQAVSFTGTWIQQTAMSWLVYRLTGSVFLLGIAGFADKIPSFFLTPFAGVFLDRSDRHRVVLVTQVLLLLQALALAVLTLTGKIQVWHVMALALLLGFINAFDIPARQSLTVELIDDREDLGNAIALNSSLFNGARLLGPSIAGVLLVWISEGHCFLLNAASYLAAILALSLMTLSFRERDAESAPVLKKFREGFAYTFGFPPTRAILLLLSLSSLVGMPYTVLLPVFAANTLGGGPKTFGFLMAASGLGALAGALYMASRRSVIGLWRWMAVSCALFGLGLAAFAFSKNIYLSSAALVLAGFGMMMHMASSNTVLQTIVDDDKRGRVMSFYVVSITGMAPFGSLLAGSLASWAGAPATVLLGGIICILGSILLAFQLPLIRKHIRPLYVQMGLIPEEE